MPVPFIPIFIAAGAAIYGGKKGKEASDNMSEAKRINKASQDYAKEAEDFIVMAKSKTNTAVTEFGKAKVRVLTNSITDFVTEFEKIKNVEFSNSRGINELKYFSSSSESFRQLKIASFEARQIAVNGIAAIGSGALLAYGTYSVVMSGLGGMLVTATTGTALASLSGAAATNATLAWLGGGALSVGGLGMAGGMMVLGGLVAGPALAIGGSIFASQAKAALNNAYSNFDKARAFRAQAKNIGVALKGICVRAEQLTELLNRLDYYFAPTVSVMRNIITTAGTNWQNYSISEKKEIYKSVQLAQTIKIILDASLLKEDGTLNDMTENVLNKGNRYLQEINSL